MDERDRPSALVTGASSGIGEAFAARLAADGYDLVVVARRRERLEALAERLSESSGAGVRVHVADLTDPAQLAGVEELAAAEPSLDMVVNNAGFPGYGPFVQLGPDMAEDLIRIHNIAPIRVTRAALPGMIERGRGSIINVASLLAFSQSLPPGMMPFRSTYAACKAFLVTFTVALRHELEGTGVRAMVYCPGMVETEFHGLDYQGPPRMKADLSVAACMKGLEFDEAICAPTLEDPSAIDAFHEAQRALASGALSLAPAPRYLSNG
jgi:hypothetical protein